MSKYSSDSSDSEDDFVEDPLLCGLRLEVVPSLRKTVYKLLPLNDALTMSVEDEEAAVQKVKEEGEKQRLQIISERDELIDKIPGFWAKVLNNHTVSNFFSPEDKVIAGAIVSLRVKSSLTSFEATIRLAKNSAVENTELHKAFKEGEDGTDKAECTKIKWIKKPAHSKKAAKKRGKNSVSVFSWFGTKHGDINDDFIITTLTEIYEEAFQLYTQN